MNCSQCSYAANLGRAKNLAGVDVDHLVCRRNPPTLVPVMVQGKRTPSNPQGVDIQPASFFAPCPQAPLDSCGEWKKGVPLDASPKASNT